MNALKAFDWVSFVIYLILVVAGWFTINAASYNFDESSIWDFNRPSGKQAVWFGLSLLLVVIILCIEAKTYMTYAPIIYIGIMVLLVVTLAIAPSTKGSHSWLKFGSFSIQPAEFGKFSTSLMLAWLFNTYNFKFAEISNFLKACGIILLPVAIIILQNETGSALVYFSLILLFYRQGMSGIFLWAIFCFILIFVVGVKYSVEPIPDGVVLGKDESAPPSAMGENLVLAIIPFLVAAMLWVYTSNIKAALTLSGIATAIYGGEYLFNHYVEHPFTLTFRWFGLAVCIFSALYCIWLLLVHKLRKYLYIFIFSIGFLSFQYSVGYAFEHVLQKHQRGRIEVLLGMKEDLKGAGYNVNQAEIAIGSGGIAGKGYLQGTQTKLSYVPEQETDFIFCTIGEEQGFIGTTAVLLLYTLLILRILWLSERQRTVFAQVYGYCVASILTFHVIINVGMVIGLVPVIGIPLPFFSYGGSGLWSFTILLFIFLKLDAQRIERY